MRFDAKEIVSPKFSQIVATAENLFMRHGIKRVTIEEICRTADVSKMTFYKFFRNKEDLTEYIVDQLVEDAEQKFENVFSQDISLEQKLQQWIQIKLEYSRSMSKEFYYDLLRYNNALHDRLVKRAAALQNKVLDLFRDAKRQGEMNPDLTVDLVAYMLNHMMTIVEDEQFEGMYTNLEDMTRDLAAFFFYGVFGESKEKDSNDL